MLGVFTSFNLYHSAMPAIVLNNRYEYYPDTDLLGTGSLGTVYKAYDSQRRRYVAIKKFIVTNESRKYSLEEEFMKSIEFSHGNLVRSYDFFSTTDRLLTGEAHETQYGVMELIEGGDLARYLQTNPPLPELLEVVKGILYGLQYLHTPDPKTNKGVIIHRDIKPANILIFRNNVGEPVPKIADFNIAKEITNKAVTQTVVGTPEYMSPEQFLPTQYGSNGKLLPNTDLWSFGVLLCDHLLQRSVFGRRSNGQTQGEIMRNVLDLPIPTAEIDRLPAPFKQIISVCLVRSATDRIQSADALLTLINQKENTIIVGPEDDTIIVGPTPTKKDTVRPRSKKVIASDEPTQVVTPKRNVNWAIISAVSIAFILVGGYIYNASNTKGGDGKPAIKMVSIPGSNFKMSETEVTIGQYLAFCKATNSHYPAWLEEGSKYNIDSSTDKYYKEVGMSESNTNYPITGVSATDADAFCRWMGGHLPTETEWEYAAQGGQSYEYAGSDNIGEVAWYDDNSGSKAHPVKQKRANGYGLYDMSGNVWEWTSSTEGTSRVLRGGSWYDYAQYCRVANRYISTPDYRINFNGFRLAVGP